MNNLRRIRRAKDMTLQQLADETNSTKSYIFELEKGTIQNPSLSKARFIAKALTSTLDEVFPKVDVVKKAGKLPMDKIVKAHIDKLDYDTKG